ncbi:hypothetical protein PG990_003256 [Apiospora arundinis]|uniref:Uncharacterized protein n=1 Tax=Apiospora arundinis TaxID=335852 RepID=A0ABR2IGG5_9PEZI
MSHLRNFLGLAIAVGFGVWNAQYALKPALEEEARRKDQNDLAQAAARGRAAKENTGSQQETVKKN